MQEKKGQILNTLVPTILALVFAAIILIFGIIISQAAIDAGYAYTKATAINQSASAVVKDAGTTLAYANLRDVACGDVYKIYNQTNHIAISLNNLTQYGTGNCSIKYKGEADGVYNNTIWRLTYNYTWTADTGASIAANKTVVGLGTFADYWEIIVLAIVISIVISLLLVLFAAKGKAQ